ncbi:MULTISPECIES: hypothetical protein [unclassified Bacillus (in: firmicutes)]|uniref:hypothetical protein n=1 Tax=unclassified Bacillus (in: firmicutes) TaxID=185979 RepID=UPI0008F258FE|nr:MULTISPECIES: hypothetical protein [unclassified Bacillus (in: firmicutes)]SFB09403.1 hypothetical protein SAMN02799634_105253 [Bacillus sp. UNCCL13]SFQ86720.1 hypothetical protein SAMN04488577_2867 [Bacillus sp. cl95]
MSRIFTDYHNKTAITLPDEFIDVKTGDTHIVSSKIQDQIEYHAKNNTLIHLVLSALNSYLHPRLPNGNLEEVLLELSEIKKMLQYGTSPKKHSPYVTQLGDLQKESKDLNLEDIEEVLNAFGG